MNLTDKLMSKKSEMSPDEQVFLRKLLINANEKEANQKFFIGRNKAEMKELSSSEKKEFALEIQNSCLVASFMEMLAQDLRGKQKKSHILLNIFMSCQFFVKYLGDEKLFVKYLLMCIFESDEVKDDN